MAQPLPALQREIPHSHYSLWAKTCEPSKPARALCHLPPMTPNSRLGQELVPVSSDPEGSVPQCPQMCLPGQVHSQLEPQLGWSLAGSPILRPAGLVTEGANDDHQLSIAPHQPSCYTWPCPGPLSLSSFSSPPSISLFLPHQACPMVLPAGGVAWALVLLCFF